MSYITFDEDLKSQFNDMFAERAISIETADAMLRKMALLIAVQKREAGIYDETEYLMAIPGMAEKIREGLQEPIEDCTDIEELWPDVFN